MTREEFELAISRVDATDFNATTKTFAIVAQYTFELEQRITELEAPNTCKLDCAYYDNEYGCNCPFPCTRIKDDDAKDYYEPKEHK